jgi:hypothetical protein
MSIKNRPYVGNWQINKTLVRHTPDAIVYINGHPEFVTCPSCNKKFDFNKYVTSVTCDAGVEPSAGASVRLSVPKSVTEVFSHDGNYVLKPGLEVTIFMRGYFPMEGYALLGQEEESGDKTPVYPYYQTFRGVVTNVSHEFSGGFYAISLSCANMLHFWANQYVSTNGAVFGPRPDGSGVGPNLTGHTFTGNSPYTIIYTLMRIGFGAAYNVGWSIQQRTNIDAVAEGSDQSLYAHAAEWWEKRWRNSSLGLRMYGFDGSLFNQLEQSYLGMFGSRSSDRKFILSYNTLPDGTSNNFNMTAGKQATEKALGYRASETTAAFMDDDGYKLDIIKMQAFTFDMGNIAKVNFFESEYMSKLEIAEAVTGITGFEFYQDVDGDIVFKPPFYNLDTSDDPVYVIEDRDLISISEVEAEPEATYVKATGGLFGNTTGVLSGEFGTKQSMYIDWRLVAKYGWKETSFESHYLNNASQLYVSSMSRLDIANAQSRTATITIPIRPEMRPGYPVYVRSMDCYFYVRNISHSFSPGSECTTTLTCIAKRSKFLPPGKKETEGNLPKLSDVKFAGGGEYAPMPLYVYPKNVEGNDREDSGPPRIMGFPNCVMALDPNAVNLSTVGGGELVFSQPDNVFEFALSQGVLRQDIYDPNVYKLAIGEGVYLGISKDNFYSTWEGAYTFLQEYSRNPSGENYEALIGQVGSQDLSNVLIRVLTRFQGAIGEDATKNWLAIQRSLKTMYGFPAVTGKYRYFSSSAPQASDQSPSEITYNPGSGLSFETIGPPSGGEITVLSENSNGEVEVKSGTPERAFRVYGFTGQDTADYRDLTTDQIRFASFQVIRYSETVILTQPGDSQEAAFLVDRDAYEDAVKRILIIYAESVPTDETASKRFGTGENGYGGVYASIQKFQTAVGATGVTDEQTDASTLANALAKAFNRGYWKKETVERTGESDLGTSEGDISTESGDIDDSLGFSDPDDFEEINVYVAPTPKYGGRNPDNGTVLETRYSNTNDKSDSRALNDIAGDAARVLTNFMDACQTELRETLVRENRENDFANYLEARNEMLSILDAYEEESPGLIVANSSVVKEVGVPTAVLPVSDNRGYEVYGSLAYGRGLTVDTQYDLIAQSNRAIDAQSADAIEAVVSGLIGSGADLPGVLGVLRPDRKAKLAANLSLPAGAADSEIIEAIETLSRESRSGSAFIRNNPITSKSRGMSYSEGVVVSELSFMEIDGENACICNGVDASYFLQAFTGEYQTISEDSVGEFLKNEALAAGESWKVTRDAVSGTNTSAGQNIISTVASSYKDRVSDVIELRQDLTEAGGQFSELESDGE